MHQNKKAHQKEENGRKQKQFTKKKLSKIENE
jgi:hypothetical protein